MCAQATLPGSIGRKRYMQALQVLFGARYFRRRAATALFSDVVHRQRYLP